MNSFTYHDVSWKIGGVSALHEISAALKTNELHRLGFHSFLDNCVTILTYSAIKGIINLNVHEIPTGYSLTIDYHATKHRSETLLEYLRIIKSGKKPNTGITPWKINLAGNLISLVNKSKEVKILRREPFEKGYPVSLQSEIDFDKLITADEPIDKPDPHASLNSRPFIVPPELLDEIINENLCGIYHTFRQRQRKIISIA